MLNYLQYTALVLGYSSQQNKHPCLHGAHILEGETEIQKISTGWGKSRFTVVHMENNTITNKQ